MARRFRIIIDTNVWVSYLLWPSDLITSAVRLALHHGDILASEATLDELSATLLKPKFNRYLSDEARHSFCADVAHISSLVTIGDPVTDCRDPRDNMFLEVAASGNVDIIITGDNDLLTLHPWRGVLVLTPRQFIELARSDA